MQCKEYDPRPKSLHFTAEDFLFLANLLDVTMNLMTQFSKIIATVGPSTTSPETIKKLIEAGVSVFRFNLKHNTHNWHLKVASDVRKASKELTVKTALMADLQGPELRTGIFENQIKKIQLHKEQTIVLSKNLLTKNAIHIPFDYVANIHDIKKGTNIFIDNGTIHILATKIGDSYIAGVVKEGGPLGIQKSVSIPKATIDVPTLTAKDKKDITFALTHNFDYIALSFVRNEKDVINLKTAIKRLGGGQKVISKIETVKAVENFDAILKESHSIMVARGDLGIEIPIERLPKLQKELIKKCRNASKPIIVATQMLKSMVTEPIPTRAEVADIANAVFDKTDALMLSEETAIGNLPIKSVSMMSKIARYNENYKFEDDIIKTPESDEEIIISSSIRFTKQHPNNKNGIKGYVVFTESGRSARMLSRYRAPLPIYAFTTHITVSNQLALSYGVIPINIKLQEDPVKNIRNAINLLKDTHFVDGDDRLIVIFGNNVGVPESNNNLSIVRV